MDLRQLEILCAIAETGTFTGAGEKLHVSQSAISRQVLLLEDELREPLFIRRGRGAVPTRVGQQLIQLGRRLLEDLTATVGLIRDQRQEMTGLIRIAGGMTVCLYVLPLLLKEFRLAHPRVDVKLITGATPRLIRQLKSGLADIALLTLPVEEPSCVVVKALREELMLVMPPAHPLASKRRVTPKDLALEPFVLFEPLSNTRRTADCFFTRVGIEPRVVLETENVEILKALVASGMGLTIIPYQSVAAEVQAGTLASTRIAGEVLERETGWVYPRSAHLPRAVQELITTLQTLQPRLEAGAGVSAGVMNLAAASAAGRQPAPAAAGPSESASRGTAARGGGAPRAIDIDIDSASSSTQTRGHRPGTGYIRAVADAMRGTVLTHASATAPLKLFAPRITTAAAWVYTTTLGGGLLGGDDIRLAIDLDDGARVVALTQASTKIYRSRRASRQSVDVTVGAGAVFVLLPDPVVPFADSSFDQRLHVTLHADGSLLALDGFTSGRLAFGERWAFDRYATRLEIVREGRRAFLDQVRLDRADASIEERMRQFNVFMTLVAAGPVFAPLAAEALERVAAMPAPSATPLMPSGAAGMDPHLVMSVSPLGEDGMVLRLAAASIEDVTVALRSFLRPIMHVLGDDPWGRRY